MPSVAIKRVSLAGVIVILALGACGGSADVTTSGDPTTDTVSDGSSTTIAPSDVPATDDLPDPCSLLNSTALEKATGLGFGDGEFNESLSNENQLVCDWITTGDQYAFAQVLIAGVDGTFLSAKAGAAGVFTLVEVDIPGAADAYATEEGSLVGMDVGGLFLQVSYIPPGPGNVLDQTEQLAAEAVSNL